MDVNKIKEYEKSIIKNLPKIKVNKDVSNIQLPNNIRKSNSLPQIILNNTLFNNLF